MANSDVLQGSHPVSSHSSLGSGSPRPHPASVTTMGFPVGSPAGRPAASATSVCYWKDMWHQLDAMRQACQLCDVQLLSSDNQLFAAHAPVLAASSPVFHDYFILKSAPGVQSLGPGKLQLALPANVLRFTLDFIYGHFPTSAADLQCLKVGADALRIHGAVGFLEHSLSRMEAGPARCPIMLLRGLKEQQPGNTDMLARWASSNCPMRNSASNDPGQIFQNTSLGTPAPIDNLSAWMATVDSGGGKPARPIETIQQPDHPVQTRQQLATDTPKYCQPPLKTVHSEGGILLARAQNKTMPSLKEYQGDPVSLDHTSKIPHLRKCPYISSGQGMIPNYSSIGNPNGGSKPSKCPHGFTLGDLKLIENAEQLMDLQKMNLNQAMCGAGGLPSASQEPFVDVVSIEDTSNCPDQQATLDMMRLCASKTPAQSSPSPSVHSQQRSDTRSPYVPHTQRSRVTCPLETPLQTIPASADPSAPLVSSRPQGCPSLASNISSLGQTYVDPSLDAILPLHAPSPISIHPSAGLVPLLTDESSPGKCPFGYTGSQLSPHSSTIVPTHSQDLLTEAALSDLYSDKDHTSETSQPPVPEFTVLVPMKRNSHETDESAMNKRIRLVDDCADPSEPAVCGSSKLVSPKSCLFSAAAVTVPSQQAAADLLPAEPIVTPVSSATPDDPGLQPAISLSRPTSPVSGTPSQALPTSPEESTEDSLSNPTTAGSLDQSIVRNSNCAPRVDSEAIKCNSQLETMLQSLQSPEGTYHCLEQACEHKNPHLDNMLSHLWRRHERGRPSHACQLCDLAYFSFRQWKTHFKSSHCDGVTATLQEDIVCSMCGERCSNRTTLQLHQLREHKQGTLYHCQHCHFKTPRRKDLQVHLLSQHGLVSAGVQVFSCEYCDYRCLDKNRHEEHLAKHTGIPQFKCPSCSKSYTTKRGLKTHQAYHSEERPHHCTQCSAAFKVRSKLRDHVRLMHTNKGEKPFKCSYCDHHTSLRGNCNQHIRKYHPGQDVVVIDLLAARRRPTKPYNYASFTGDNIKLTTEIGVPVGASNHSGRDEQESAAGKELPSSPSQRRVPAHGVQIIGKAVVQSLKPVVISAEQCELQTLSIGQRRHSSGETA